MPALSPTMTEGNIAKWQVKEGDKFAAGDVLLEIETDKATMDVEAQEDGIVMKIMSGDGTKGIQVGQRIAVIAEEGDDISALEIPADESSTSKPATESPKSESAPAGPQAAEPTPAPAQAASKSGHKAPRKNHTLLPSVQHLLKENGLDASAASDITPTGPNGRILKGDVLAFLGKINANIPSEIESRFQAASHLDLSNIKVAKAPEPKKADKKAAAPVPEAPKEAVVSLSVSVEAITKAQRSYQKKLGVDLSFSSFVFRASEIANEQLPRAKPTSDRLFNELLGLQSEADYYSRGAYLPDIGTVRLTTTAAAPKPARARKSDILDLLSATPARKTSQPKSPSDFLTTGPAATFSLTVPSAEAQRATVFLQRVKDILESEPEKLVL